jgi:hypothetical protein
MVSSGKEGLVAGGFASEDAGQNPRLEMRKKPKRHSALKEAMWNLYLSSLLVLPKHLLSAFVV